jgi:hypothetical protein
MPLIISIWKKHAKLCTICCPANIICAPSFLVIGPNFRQVGNTGLDATAWYETIPPPFGHLAISALVNHPTVFIIITD